MKYLLILLLTLSANVFAAPSCEDNPNNPNCSGDYPGSVPSWDERFAVTCSMTNQEDGVLTASFTEANLDYLTGGTLMTYLAGGVVSWHEAITAQLEDEGVNTRMMPRVNGTLKDLIEIERVMSGKFDE